MLFGVVSNGIQPCMAINCYTVVIHETQLTYTSKLIKFVCSIGNKNSFEGFIGRSSHKVLSCFSFFFYVMALNLQELSSCRALESKMLNLLWFRTRIKRSLDFETIAVFASST